MPLRVFSARPSKSIQNDGARLPSPRRSHTPDSSWKQLEHGKAVWYAQRLYELPWGGTATERSFLKI